jgi:hypothetical protein
MPHPLSEAQDADRTAMTNDPLSVLHRQAGYSLFALWQVTSFSFSINVYLTICLQRAEMKSFQEKKPR